jgi:hypothetical protein
VGGRIIRGLRAGNLALEGEEEAHTGLRSQLLIDF